MAIASSLQMKRWQKMWSPKQQFILFTVRRTLHASLLNVCLPKQAWWVVQICEIGSIIINPNTLAYSAWKGSRKDVKRCELVRRSNTPQSELWVSESWSCLQLDQADKLVGLFKTAKLRVTLSVIADHVVVQFTMVRRLWSSFWCGSWKFIHCSLKYGENFPGVRSNADNCRVTATVATSTDEYRMS